MRYHLFGLKPLNTFCYLSSSICMRAGLFPFTPSCTHPYLFSAWVYLNRWVKQLTRSVHSSDFRLLNDSRESGLLVQNMSAESCLHWPEFYTVGQRQELFNPLTICMTLLYSIYTSVVLFFLPFGVFQGSDTDYHTLAVTVEMSAVLSVTVEVCLLSKISKLSNLSKKKFICKIWKIYLISSQLFLTCVSDHSTH